MPGIRFALIENIISIGASFSFENSHNNTPIILNMPTATGSSESAASSIVKDPFLQSVLATSTLTRDQCLTLVDLVSSRPISSSEPRTPFTEDQLELTKQQKLLYSYLSQLRGQNRDALWKVRATKQETAEARQEVDRLHLQLGNLYYEEKHLRGEVAACESYE